MCPGIESGWGKRKKSRLEITFTTKFIQDKTRDRKHGFTRETSGQETVGVMINDLQ